MHDLKIYLKLLISLSRCFCAFFCIQFFFHSIPRSKKKIFRLETFFRRCRFGCYICFVSNELRVKVKWKANMLSRPRCSHYLHSTHIGFLCVWKWPKSDWERGKKCVLERNTREICWNIVGSSSCFFNKFSVCFFC